MYIYTACSIISRYPPASHYLEVIANHNFSNILRNIQLFALFIDDYFTMAKFEQNYNIAKLYSVLIILRIHIFFIGLQYRQKNFFTF
jgi:hypothetical protein